MLNHPTAKRNFSSSWQLCTFVHLGIFLEPIFPHLSPVGVSVLLRCSRIGCCIVALYCLAEFVVRSCHWLLRGKPTPHSSGHYPPYVHLHFTGYLLRILFSPLSTPHLLIVRSPSFHPSLAWWSLICETWSRSKEFSFLLSSSCYVLPSSLNLGHVSFRRELIRMEGVGKVIYSLSYAASKVGLRLLFFSGCSQSACDVLFIAVPAAARDSWTLLFQTLIVQKGPAAICSVHLFYNSLNMWKRCNKCILLLHCWLLRLYGQHGFSEQWLTGLCRKKFGEPRCNCHQHCSVVWFLMCLRSPLLVLSIRWRHWKRLGTIG